MTIHDRIVERRALGASIQSLADDFGLSKSGVNAVLDAEAQGRPSVVIADKAEAAERIKRALSAAPTAPEAVAHYVLDTFEKGAEFSAARKAAIASIRAFDGFRGPYGVLRGSHEALTAWAGVLWAVA